MILDTDLHDGGGFAPAGMRFVGYCPQHWFTPVYRYQIEYQLADGLWDIHSTGWEQESEAQEIIDLSGMAHLMAMRVRRVPA